MCQRCGETRGDLEARRSQGLRQTETDPEKCGPQNLERPETQGIDAKSQIPETGRLVPRNTETADGRDTEERI